MAQPRPAREATPALEPPKPAAPNDARLLRFLDEEERAAARRRDFAAANRLLDQRLGIKARISNAQAGTQ